MGVDVVDDVVVLVDVDDVVVRVDVDDVDVVVVVVHSKKKYK